ncbi:hypothetical protein Lpl14_11357, partial [Lacticaseibacillus paracasei subsp. tolerans Lpl14]
AQAIQRHPVPRVLQLQAQQSLQFLALQESESIATQSNILMIQAQHRTAEVMTHLSSKSFSTSHVG